MMNLYAKIYAFNSQSFPTKISLLVCQSINTAFKTQQSRAIIGFSASGPKHLIIPDRKRNLPVLESLSSPPLETVPWPVGNCAEDETFAHLNGLRNSLLESDQKKGNGTITVALTIDLTTSESIHPCPQCQVLLYKLRKTSHSDSPESPFFVFSIAPDKARPDMSELENRQVVGTSML